MPRHSISCTSPNDDWLKARVEMLAEQPPVYPAVDEIRVGYRRSVSGAAGIYYRVTGNGVEVMAITGQQDLDDWL